MYRNKTICLLLTALLTQFFGNPVKAKGELLNLDDQVVGERGKAGCSEKWEEKAVINKYILGSVSSLSACVAVSLAVSHLVAVVLDCTAELQKSVRISGSLRAAMQAVKGICARTVGADESPSSRRRSASWSSSV